MISKEELDRALVQNAKEMRGKNDNHERVDTVALLDSLRVQSAFGAADKNNDGQIDYEEFLRMLHPEFHDDDMTMDNFKHNIVDVDSGRVRGAQFDVDYSSADAGRWNVPASSPSSIKSGASSPSKRALQLDAFKLKSGSLSAKEAESMRNLYEQKVEELEQQLADKDARIAELEAEVARLQNK